MSSLVQAEQIWVNLQEIFIDKASANYGLSELNQREHALQAAHLAERAGHTSALVIAALLHDIGHMIHSLGEHPAAVGIDDRHEDLGANFLAQYFDASVVEPVRLHVQAKRYLCALDKDYMQRLSSDSKESLVLQGGAMNAAEMEKFLEQPYARDAIIVRRLDEAAKKPGLDVPSFDHYKATILSLLTRASPDCSNRR
ncbi:HD domain-containing protein [Limnobacter sp.]|uniref:HD domain-containing protein n=1 Tax=Limnobacter sp. TaxID=2003368 RepID=UPI002588005C|nr:HD domain-containing protein [Limnobacter sp.]